MGNVTLVPWAPQHACSSQRQSCLCACKKVQLSALKHLPSPVLQGTLQSGFRCMRISRRKLKLPQTWEIGYPALSTQAWMKQPPWLFHSCNNLQRLKKQQWPEVRTALSSQRGSSQGSAAHLVCRRMSFMVQYGGKAAEADAGVSPTSHWWIASHQQEGGFEEIQEFFFSF